MRDGADSQIYANVILTVSCEESGMKRRAVLLLLMLPVAAPAGAGTDGLCLAEATGPGRSACLELIADQRLMALETRVDTAPTQFQGATAAGVAAFGDGLRDDQRDWRRGMEKACRKQRGTARQSCRIDAISARNAQLDEAFRALPGQADPYFGDSVRIIVPLPNPANDRIRRRLGRGGRLPEGQIGEPFPFLEFDVPLHP